ncbi:MAG: hypothetical protein DRQ03_07750, partial [Candidatus Hydrothermota bacterium]
SVTYLYSTDTSGNYTVKAEFFVMNLSNELTVEFEVLPAEVSEIPTIPIEFYPPGQGAIVIGEPVNWTQEFFIANSLNRRIEQKICLPLPEDAFGIEILKNESQISNSSCFSIALLENESLKLTARFKTSPVEIFIKEISELDLSSLIPEDASEIKIYEQDELIEEYPKVLEEITVPVLQKGITLQHNSSLHYQNITLEIETPFRNLTIIEMVNDSIHGVKEKISGEKVELLVPELSNRTYILSSKIERTQEKAIINEPVNWTLRIENITIRYKTPAPVKIESEPEIENGKWIKRIFIESNATVHYHNVTAFSDLGEEEKFDLRLYWLINGTRRDVTCLDEFNVSFIDSNDNGILDRVSWNVPQLSNQSYEIEADITVINVQSYPTIGGNWTVMFNTTGTANLTITAVNGTTWTNQPYECYDEETEILTPDGWKYFYELDGDEIATLNPETRETEWQKPTAYQVYQHDGEMYNIVLEDGSELLVSPEHRVYGAIANQSSLRSLKSDQSSPSLTLISTSKANIPVVNKVSNVGSGGELIIPNILSRTKSITAPINPQPIISNAKVILSSIYSPKNLLAINPAITPTTTPIRALSPSSYPKPRFIRKITPITTNTPIKTDLSSFDTISKYCDQSYLDNFSLEGITEIYEKLKENKDLEYYLLDSDKNLVKVKKIDKVPYSGKIYGVTVPNHIILVKRKGKGIWSGNSNYDLQFLEIRCGNKTLNYSWFNDSVFIENYSCNETGYEISKVLTTGKHTLKFKFGTLIEYAHNWASDLSNWSYRQPINISNTAGDLTNYQVKIELNSSNVGSNFNWSNNGSDIRFTNSTDDLLNFWIESWNSTGQEATIWVNVTYLENNTNTTIYMYYGNPSASSASDGEATFEFFDDFEDGNLDPWQQYDTDHPASISTDWSSDGTYSVKIEISELAYSGITKELAVPNVHVLADVYVSDVFNDVVYFEPTGQIIRDSVGTTKNWESNTITSSSYNIIFRNEPMGPDNKITAYVDRVRVRKYASPEPSVSNFGSEETAPVLFSINLTSPPNQTHFDIDTENQPNFNFTAISNTNTTFSCELFINDTSYGSNSSVQNNTATIIQANSPLSLGEYNWYINCTDSSGTTKSEVRTFYMENISVSVNTDKSVYNPNQNVTVSGKAILLPDQTNVTNTNVSIYLDDVLNGTVQTDSNGNYSYVFKAPSTQGIYNLKVNLTNENGIYGENQTTFQVDTTSPTITFVSPTEPNGTTINRNWTEVNMTITESNLDTFRFN